MGTPRDVSQSCKLVKVQHLHYITVAHFLTCWVPSTYLELNKTVQYTWTSFIWIFTKPMREKMDHFREDRFSASMHDSSPSTNKLLWPQNEVTLCNLEVLTVLEVLMDMLTSLFLHCLSEAHTFAANHRLTLMTISLWLRSDYICLPFFKF